MDVTMPQLGETVTEGTITKWFKQVGEKIDADEPLFEVSTDKVDSEVPAPQVGYVTEIVVQEGETVPVGARLAVISEQAGARAAPAPAPAAPGAPHRPRLRPHRLPRPLAAPVAPAPARSGPGPGTRTAAGARAAPRRTAAAANGGGAVTSPIVRRLIEEQGLDPPRSAAPARAGASRATTCSTRRRARGPVPRRARRPPAPRPRPRRRAPVAARSPRAVGDEIVPFDNIRRRTAEHMVRSLATSAHVYTSVRVDFERVERVRAAHQAEWTGRRGIRAHVPAVHRPCLLRRRARLPARQRERRG